MDATQLLHRAGEGDADAERELIERVHGELHTLALQLMRSERVDHTLQATALLNEAWLRLTGPRSSPSEGEPTPSPLAAVEDTRHFQRLAARVMRRVLVDHARNRGRDKRGGGSTRITLGDPASDPESSAETDAVDLLDLEAALVGLEERDPELARIVELRFFAGLSLEETGEALGVTERAVRHAWGLARAWLRRELERGT